LIERILEILLIYATTSRGHVVAHLLYLVHNELVFPLVPCEAFGIDFEGYDFLAAAGSLSDALLRAEDCEEVVISPGHEARYMRRALLGEPGCRW
jgi:hypothetical protein